MAKFKKILKIIIVLIFIMSLIYIVYKKEFNYFWILHLFLLLGLFWVVNKNK